MLQGDDDVFVNMQNIIDYVVSFPNDKAKDIFTGSVLYPSPRITDPKSKYYVSSNLWNEKYYPPYVSGESSAIFFVRYQWFKSCLSYSNLLKKRI